MKKIAVIGTGIMGNGIAANYLKAGYQVFLWNRTKEKLDAHVQRGGVIVDTPRDAAQQADIVFEVTANDESSRSVWLGDEGILAGAHTDAALISSATLSVTWIDELGRLCAERGLTFFDMPLTGGRSGAESGNLTLLVGGDKDRLEEVKPDLMAISKEVFYFGPAGSGIRFKLILNMVQGIHLIAFGDAMNMAEDAGMDVMAVGEALAQRMGGTTAMGWRDYQNIPDPINFSTQWIAKDLAYAKEMATSLRIDTPLLDEALKKYLEAIEKGMGNEDWTAVTHLQ